MFRWILIFFQEFFFLVFWNFLPFPLHEIFAIFEGILLFTGSFLLPIEQEIYFSWTCVHDSLNFNLHNYVSYCLIGNLLLPNFQPFSFLRFPKNYYSIDYPQKSYPFKFFPDFGGNPPLRQENHFLILAISVLEGWNWMVWNLILAGASLIINIYR